MFVGQRPLGMECRHLDGNPANNKLDNLRWGTKLENWQDKKIHGNAPCMMGSKNPSAKVGELQVRIIIRLTKDGYLTLNEIGKIFGLKTSQVSRIKNHKSWSHIEKEKK